MRLQLTERDAEQTTKQGLSLTYNSTIKQQQVAAKSYQFVFMKLNVID